MGETKRVEGRGLCWCHLVPLPPLEAGIINSILQARKLRLREVAWLASRSQVMGR